MSKENLSAVSRRKAEDRIRKDVIVKCKVCDGIMKFHRAKTDGTTFIVQGMTNYYHCAICLRNVVLTQL